MNAPHREGTLIIQGPMLSSHRPEGQWASMSDQYDCMGTVSRLTADGRQLFRRIVLSTWDDEPGRMASYSFRNDESVTVVLSSDPISASTTSRSAQMRRFPDNRIHQFYSTLAGLQACDGDGDEIVVKVRSDQWIDLRKLMASARDVETRSRRLSQCDTAMIMVPALFGRPPFAVDDSYLVARRTALDAFLHAQLDANYSRAIGDIHSAMMLVWYDALYRGKFQLARGNRFPISGRSSSHRPIFPTDERHYELAAKMVLTAMQPLSRAIHESLIWRGVPIHEYETRAKLNGRLPPLLFSENIPDNELELTTLLRELCELDRRSRLSSNLLARILSYERCGFGSILNPLVYVLRRYR